MTDRSHAQRPYRVVFTRPGEPRRGTIVIASESVACREARAIAEAGGRAEVQYVEPGGTRRTVATYP